MPHKKYNMRSSVSALNLCILFCLALFSSGCRATLRPTRPVQVAGQPPWQMHVIDNELIGADGGSLQDADLDGDLDLVIGWEESGRARAYLNPGANQERNSAPWPGRNIGLAPGAEDAAWGDIDNDGYLDVVTPLDLAQELRIHFAPEGGGLDNEIFWETQTFDLRPGQSPFRYMTVAIIDFDNDGDLDIITGGRGENAHIEWFEAPSENQRQLDRWRMHQLSPVGWTMSLFVTDMDSDGDLDILVTDRTSESHNLRGVRWLENRNLPSSTNSNANNGYWDSHFIYQPSSEELEGSPMLADLVDIDGDTLLDIIVPIVNPNQLLWLRRLNQSGHAWEQTLIPVPSDIGHRVKAATAADINLDGTVDIVLSSELNDGNTYGVIWLDGRNDWRAYPISSRDGVKFDTNMVIDINEDGYPDIIQMEEATGLGVIWYENPGASLAE